MAIIKWQVIVTALCAFVVLISQGVQCELFTALVEMEDLLDTEGVLITNLENYIRVQDEKLELLRV